MDRDLLKSTSSIRFCNWKRKDINTDLSNVPLSTQPETMLTSFQRNISIQENVAYGQVGSRIRK